MEKETSTSSTSTPLSKLKDSINSMIIAKANNLEQIAKGEEPEHPISSKDWDDVLKTIKDMPNLERLYAVLGEPIDNSTEKEPILDAEIEITKGNSFEETSRKIKEKRLNGSTKISTEAH